MSAGIDLIIAGLKQRGLSNDWSTDEPVKTVNLPHITRPSDWPMAPTPRSPGKSTLAEEFISMKMKKLLEEETRKKMMTIADFESEYMVNFDESELELPAPLPGNDFLTKKGGGWTKAPKRMRSGDPTAKLKLPEIIGVKDEWERGEIGSEAELDQYLLAILNKHLLQNTRTLMVKTAMTFMFRDRNWTFTGAEFYRLVAVAPAKNELLTFDKMAYYLEAEGAGIEPVKLYGLNAAGLRKLFGDEAAVKTVQGLINVIHGNPQYKAAKEAFERKKLSDTYAEDGIEFGGW